MSDSKRRGMNPVLAFFLGFLLAVILIGGTVGIAVAVLLNYKIDKISANKDSEGNYIFINADAESGGASTVLDLVKKLTALSKDYKSLTLGEAEELVPVLGKLTDKLNASLSEFVILGENELEQVRLGEMESFVNSLAERIDVARLIGANADNNILVYLCYGVSSVKYDAATETYSAKYKDANGEIRDCTLLVDGGKVSGAQYTVNGETLRTPALTLNNVNARVDGVCNDLTIGEIVEISESDRIFGSIKNSTISTISDDVNSICIQQLFPDDIYARETPTDGAQSPKAEIYLAVDGNPEQAAEYDKNLIYYVKDGEGNYSLAETNGKITQELYDKGTQDGGYYTFGAGRIGFDARFVYYLKDEDGSYAMINAGTDKQGKLDSLSADSEVYTYGGASALWKLLLYTAPSEGAAQEETVYNFQNINTMISNVTKNTQNTSMRELDAAGILVFKNKADLDSHVRWHDGEGNNDKILGEMSLSEVIGVMVYIVNNPTELLPAGLPVIPVA